MCSCGGHVFITEMKDDYIAVTVLQLDMYVHKKCKLMTGTAVRLPFEEKDIHTLELRVDDIGTEGTTLPLHLNIH